MRGRIARGGKRKLEMCVYVCVDNFLYPPKGEFIGWWMMMFEIGESDTRPSSEASS